MTVTEDRTATRVVSPVDIEYAREVLADVEAECRRRAAGGAAPRLLVVVDEASALLRDSDCRWTVETIARMARKTNIVVRLRDVFTDQTMADRLAFDTFGCSSLIRDAYEAGLVEIERVQVGDFVPLAAEKRPDATPTAVRTLLKILDGAEPMSRSDIGAHPRWTFNARALHNAIHTCRNAGHTQEWASGRIALTESGVKAAKLVRPC